MNTLEISTVIPIYAGSEYLIELIKALKKQKEIWQSKKKHIVLKEAIFVIDDAIDNSAELLEKFKLEFDWVKVIHLSRNFGQHPATIAGILHSSGDWVVTLDEDLQHQPKDIELLLNKVAKTNCDIVYAKPTSPVHKNIFRDYSSKSYKFIVSSLVSEKVDMFNSFRLIRGSIARATASVCGHETYFDVALLWFTQRIEQAEMTLEDQRVINNNNSTYSLSTLLSHARRMIVTARAKILRGGIMFGLVAVTSSMAYSLYIIIQKLISPELISIEGWASLFVSILFFGGTSILLLGIALEYISVILLHIQGKPTFFVIDRSGDSILKQYFEN